jgi:hypothetical protein
MLNYKMISLIAASLLVGACSVSATVSDPSICDSVEVVATIPVSPIPGVVLPPLTFTVNYDFSSTLNKVGDVADQLQANVNQLSISNNGDLDWVNELDVSVSGSTSDTPVVALASYSKGSGTPGNTVELTLKLDTATMLRYLQSGPITLTFTVSGTTPTQPVSLSNTFCVAVSGHFSKSL